MRKIAAQRGAEQSEGRQGRPQSRISRRLQEQQRQWRERSLEEKEYPYLSLPGYATYLKLRWGASLTSMALLACVGVDEEGSLGGSLGSGGCRLGERSSLRFTALRALLERGLSEQ